MENDKDRDVQPEPGGAEQPANTEDRATDRSNELAQLLGGSPQEMASTCQKLFQEKQELYDRLVRQQAEFENYRKRIQREEEEFRQRATADLVRALLPTLDGFERALKQRDSRVPGQFYGGMELIYKQLTGALSRAGLTPIDTVGKIFDPHVHQAVGTVEAPGHSDHEIVEELQKGYLFKERLLRPAIVRVAVATPHGGSGRGGRSDDASQKISLRHESEDPGHGAGE
jgi:molecular chaperone GrpE